MQDIQSRQTKPHEKKNCIVSQNTTSMWLLSQIKEKIMIDFSSCLTYLKRENIKMGKTIATSRLYPSGFMVATSNNMLMSRLVPQAKTNDFAKALSTSNLKASNDWLDRWKW